MNATSTEYPVREPMLPAEAAANVAAEARFDWPLCYAAETWVAGQIEAFLGRNRWAANLAERLRAETGTLLIDWTDSLTVSAAAETALREAGFAEDFRSEAALPAHRPFWHPEAMLPRINVDRAAPEDGVPTELAIRVDNLADFMVAHGFSGEPTGEPLSRYRSLTVAVEHHARFSAIERRGYRGWLAEPPNAERQRAMLAAHELWKTRPRTFEDDAEGFRQADECVDRLIALVGRDAACHVVFAEERAFWERRNRAAQTQKRRQDRLGLGWANHDHHTFRCSRAHFIDLMRDLEKLGFERRERYHAGEQAGWGAQILEQPVEGIVAFCDVDLDPEERVIDFSRQPLPAREKLGTIGLWTGLHGESFLDAGMHHLECRFDHDLLREQLAAEGVGTMPPFSDFPFLKQAFTEGERWPVRGERAERLWRSGLIDEAQYQRFLRDGAIGSHLENLQRRGGFKGFNQKSVSVIIAATDPRR